MFLVDGGVIRNFKRLIDLSSSTFYILVIYLPTFLLTIDHFHLAVKIHYPRLKIQLSSYLLQMLLKTYTVIKNALS